MLQELGKQNPQLLQLINANQQEFYSLLNDMPTDGMEDDPLAAAMGMPAGGAAGGGGIGPAGGVTVEVRILLLFVIACVFVVVYNIKNNIYGIQKNTPNTFLLLITFID